MEHPTSLAIELSSESFSVTKRLFGQTMVLIAEYAPTS
jgi:hypothetical protein